MSMEVLLEIGEDSRKELRIDKDNVVFAVEGELGQLGMDGILAYFSCVRGEKHRSDKRVYILQRWSEKWENFVDVTDVEQIKDGDRLTVVLDRAAAEVTEPTESFNASNSRCHVSLLATDVL